MPQVPNWAWMCFAVVVGLAVLSLLRAMAVHVRNDNALHDLRRRVFDVRISYLKQIIATYRPLEGEVEIIEDEPAEQPRMAA